MKLQDKLEGLASTAFERRVIRQWLRDGRARSNFARALGHGSLRGATNDDSAPPERDGLVDGI